MNMKYGKLVDGRIAYAPDSLDTGAGKVVNPSEATYLAEGWKKVVDVPPAADGTNVAEVSSWTEGETTLTCIYKLVPKPQSEPEGGAGGGAGGGGGNDPEQPSVRRFSKLKIVVALKAASLWILTKTWIEEKGLYDYYLAAQDFAEDNEWFLEGRAEIQRLSGKTDAEVEEILAQCVIN